MSRSESSSFLLPLIVGLVCGISLIILLLLCCRRKIKDACSNSLSQSLNINQGSATQQTVNQNETQVYSSLLHADVCVYESIRGSGNTGSGEPEHESRNITSHLQLQGRHDTEKSSDYNNVNPESFSCVTWSQSQRTSQIPATVQTVSQDENQQHIYSSLLHGDACVYESLRGPENTGDVGRAGGSTNVKSQTELRDVGQRRKRGDPGKSSDY
ncbi:uncharacterized protein LOC125023267 [Mugil cephalus]|uniref:uncharacterized protein LOC125023267 n=1 Tax=Mugil cephalus TaxID=48193 RepID=UPI001FB6F062|nr:uncharacterized protein LOC125023267 [Mugil cephalus]